LSPSGIPAGALDAIWSRNRCIVLERLDAIDRGAAGGVGPDVRDEAIRAAHQLAGTVGTFGFVQATDLARQLEAGLGAPDAVPRDLSALARRLRHELEGKVGGEPSAGIGEPSRGRVLAVDDDPTMLDAVRTLLAGAGLEVVTESDPRRVVPRLAEIDPDVLILDVDMPGLGGIELCRRVRTDPGGGHVPILFLTTHGDEATVRAAFGAGADDYLTKPLVDGELVARVRHHLEVRPQIWTRRRKFRSPSVRNAAANPIRTG
jgi:CheY-like chemotaxis protein